jgi:ankyrin repeat protein
MLDLLHEYGADVNAVAKDGCTALLGAGNNGQALAVKRMLRHGVDVHGTPLAEGAGTPLYSAINKGYISVVRVLLERGALEPRFTEGALITMMLDSLDDDTALPMLKLLLQHWGTDVNTVGGKHNTLIFAAVMRKQLKVTVYLVSAGADLQVKDVNGNTLVHAAAQCDAVRMLRWLVVTHKLNPCPAGGNGWLPLHSACHMGCLLAAEYLLTLPQAAAMLTAEDSTGFTALHIRAYHEHDDVVQLLLRKGAAVDAKTHSGATPLMYAQRLRTVSVLLKAHADVNAVDDSGSTVLHHCAKQGTAECVYNLLLKYGAVPTAVDVNGSTPAHVAGMSGHFADEALLSNAAEEYSRTHANDAAAGAVNSLSSSEQKQQRDRVNDITSSGSGSGDSASSSGSSEAAVTADSEVVEGSSDHKKQKLKQPCANIHCKKLTTKLCRRCAAVYYCSTECQKVCFKDAKRKAECRKVASTVV